MKRSEWNVGFVTPAFLGNAEQKGQWRTPPFKALLRQWWRVVEAHGVGYDVRALKEKEGKLFGYAGDGGARRSEIRVRLDEWNHGKLTNSKWKSDTFKVRHPEVGKGKMPVGSKLYLGYGPVDYKKGLKHGVAIGSGERGKLRLQSPQGVPMDDVVQLIHWFGTIGGRSRNGWGSLQLEWEAVEPLRLDHPLLESVARDWRDCMQLDWPHAIGKDEHGLLIWETEAFDSWERVMQRLAEIKVKFRTQFRFSTGKSARGEDRHVIAYPVTNHNPFGGQNRIANQIRFKVVEQAGEFKGRIVHLPCGVPDFAAQLRSRQVDVWCKVHNRLDELCKGRAQ